ncbi:MAG: heme ABC exporter ATP-binding protein CcmA [Candidatus Marinimicrobia bacterium]|nr:heme ABC exporter ATP-binding protein CcmA [Candidatus Neomarinimicrobiota bacterium]
MALLQLREVAKAFHRRPVLQDLSLTLNAGERLFLIGRNGSGKTTLLKIMAGVMRPEKGRGDLNGQPLFTSDGAWRSAVAYLGHRPALYPSFSARENLKLALKLRRKPWDETRFMELIGHYGLQGRESDPVRVFSEGMLRRLGLIRLTLTDWQVALLDEPASTLDIDGAELLTAAMNRWQADGRSLLFTSHDIAWGAAMADGWALLSQGAIGPRQSAPDEQSIREALSAAAMPGAA